MKFKKLNLSPALRISIGLISLIVAWIMLIDLLVDAWPDQQGMIKELRERTSENLAVQSAVLLQTGDVKTLKATLEEALHRDSQIYSIGIRKKEGGLALQVGNHPLYWKPLSTNKSTIDFIRVQLNANQQPWGDLEIAYHPASPSTITGWMTQPMVVSFFLLILGGVLFYSLYLRRVFNYLDPSSVIPDRVRVAFDVFTEGVMMVDRTGRIVLVNKSLRTWMEEPDNKLFGKYSKDIPWFKSALREDPKNHPWARAMDLQEPINDWPIEFQKPNGQMVKVVINCSPIQDAANTIRGCLVTFDNVTELDRINKELMLTMESLNKSQQEIEKQNFELRKLATRDPMTSCLNRRAFFESAQTIYAKAVKSRTPLSCIMADIDHFKSFNDRYGHALGDKVIVTVARALFSGLRSEDLLCRYGGEEFCILLLDAPVDIAFNIAERIREEVETNAGAGIRSVQLLAVTASLGVATLTETTASLEALIEQADQALYAAKNSGRNRVKIWEEVNNEASQQPTQEVAEQLAP